MPVFIHSSSAHECNVRLLGMLIIPSLATRLTEAIDIMLTIM